MVDEQFERLVSDSLGAVRQEAPHGSWGFSQAIAAAGFVEWSLRDWGMRIPVENRVRRAAEIVAIASQTPWDDISPEYREEVAQAAKTVLEQYLIVRAIHEPNKPLKDRLRCLLEGQVCPRRKDKTWPYDFQFELLVGAALTHAGIQGVRLEEPDWRIKAGEREVGVAAKRVSSRKNYVKLVRDAISQIRRQGLQGVIVLNFDPLVRDADISQAAALVTVMVKEARQLLATLEAEDTVFCVFGFATSFALHWSPNGAALGMEVFTHGEVIEPDLSNAAKIRAWFAKVGANIMRSVNRVMNEMPSRLPNMWPFKSSDV